MILEGILEEEDRMGSKEGELSAFGLQIPHYFLTRQCNSVFYTEPLWKYFNKEFYN